jgi:hypothetical protein
MSYAEGTSVTAERSQQEISATLRRYGAAGFMFGEDNGRAVVAFRAHDRMVRFVLPLDIDRRQFSTTPSGRSRDAASIDKAIQGEHRRRWRALALAIKAKLEVVETGIASFEDEFLANLVLPDGSTVGDWAQPQIAAAYESGHMPSLLPGPQLALTR